MRGLGKKELTDWDIMRSRTSWEVAEEAKENVFPESLLAESSSSTEIMFSGIVTTTLLLLLFALGGRRDGDEEFVNALHTCKAEALHDLDKNSIGAFGLSGRFIFKIFSDHLLSIKKKH